MTDDHHARLVDTDHDHDHDHDDGDKDRDCDSDSDDDNAAAIDHRLATRPWTFDFFAAIRWIESRHPALPRMGAASRPADEPLRLGQSPALCFAPATLDAAHPPDACHPWRLSVRFFGLWGPQGAMPLHLTERLHERTRRQPADHAAPAFADVFHHRLLALLHRAWSRAQPAPSADRRLPSGARPPDDPVEAQGRALALPARSVDDVRDALRRRWRCPVAVTASPPTWVVVPACQRQPLRSGGAAPTPGGPPLLGTRALLAGQALRIDLGPLSLSTWRSWSGPLAGHVRARVREVVPPPLAIDLRLLLRPGQAPPPRLRVARSTPRLGHDLWVGGADPGRPADEHGWRLA